MTDRELLKQTINAFQKFVDNIYDKETAIERLAVIKQIFAIKENLAHPWGEDDDTR